MPPIWKFHEFVRYAVQKCKEHLRHILSLNNPHLATMEADPTKAYNQDGRTGSSELQCAAVESGGEGAWEEVER